MRPDYVVNTFGVALRRDTSYARGVEALFARAPGLGLVVHEFVLNGDRLAMHFSEHASMPTGEHRVLTCWRGIGLYQWDGERLVANWVEQDYHALRRQLASGVSDPLRPPHHDPWVATEPVAADDHAVAAVREWLSSGDLGAAPELDIDDGRSGVPYEAVLDVTDVRVDDIFSAGPKVPFHVTLSGTYRGGLGDEYAEYVGGETTMSVAGIATVDGDGVTKVEAVTARSGHRAPAPGR